LGHASKREIGGFNDVWGKGKRQFLVRNPLKKTVRHKRKRTVIQRNGEENSRDIQEKNSEKAESLQRSVSLDFGDREEEVGNPEDLQRTNESISHE